MLPVEKTAHEGAGLSVPCVIVRRAEPYVALPASGPMPILPEFAPPKFFQLHRWMEENGVAHGGAGFFRYRRFDGGGNVELEVGNTTTEAVQSADGVIAGELPAGRYAFATHTGPYDRLYDAFLMLEGWMGGRGLEPHGDYSAGREMPVCQMEIYRVTPMDEKDPRKWTTDLLVKLAD